MVAAGLGWVCIYVSDLDFSFDEWLVSGSGVGGSSAHYEYRACLGSCAVGLRGCGLEVGEVGWVCGV